MEMWREELRKIFPNPQERKHAVKAMNINESTFSRWLNGPGHPQPANLLKIIDYLPSRERENFIGILKKDQKLYATIADRLSPDTSAHPTPHAEIYQEHLSSHIDADFYERVLSALEVTAPHLLYWSLCSLILRRALFELNAEPLGIEVSVLRCTPPQHGKIRSLYRDLAITLPEGSSPRGAGNVHNAPDGFFGIESLPGQATTSCQATDVADLTQSPYSLQRCASALAIPLLRGGRVGGCFFVSSSQVNAFRHEHIERAKQYARLLALTLETGSFYDPSLFALHSFPSYQKQIVVISTYQKHFTSFLETMDPDRAKDFALQKIEEELIIPL